MTQPATLSAPRTAPSTPPAASTPITSTDVESRSVRRLGRLWAPVDLLARAGWRTLRGARAGVGVSWATFRCRRRSVRSAASCSAGEGPPSEPDGKSAVGCWVAAVRSGAERPGLGSAEAAAAGFGVGVDFAGKLPSLRRASHRGCDPCDSRSACVRYAASPAAGGPKMPRLAAIVRPERPPEGTGADSVIQEHPHGALSLRLPSCRDSNTVLIQRHAAPPAPAARPTRLGGTRLAGRPGRRASHGAEQSVAFVGGDGPADVEALCEVTTQLLQGAMNAGRLDSLGGDA